MDEWGIDVVLSASQKGLGAPPGLCTVMVSQKAMRAFAARQTPVPAYFVSWHRWLPIMQAYQAGTAAYFATPPTNLITALEASLKVITTQPPSLAGRFAAHQAASRRIREAARSLGLKTVARSESECANGMTAIWAPEGVKPTDIIPKMLARDVVIAAGLHKDVKERYFRIGHMGITAVNTERGDLDKIIAALRESLLEAGYKP